MSERFVTMLSAEQIATRVRELGAQITQDYKDRPLVLVCVLKGSFVFAADGVPGVRARRCQVSAAAAANGEVALTVELGIAVSYGAFAADALDVVRERVSAAAASRIGTRVDRLDLTVTDLYDA